MSRDLDKVSRVTGLPKIGCYRCNFLRITNLRESSHNKNYSFTCNKYYILKPVTWDQVRVRKEHRVVVLILPIRIYSLYTWTLQKWNTFSWLKLTHCSLIYFQYYFYEFAEEGDDLHVKRPRQCLPYAVITFSLGDFSTAFQELSITQVSSFGHLLVSSVSWYSEFLTTCMKWLKRPVAMTASKLSSFNQQNINSALVSDFLLQLISLQSLLYQVMKLYNVTFNGGSAKTFTFSFET